MNDRELGEMSANIRNLCQAVDKLDKKLDARLDKVEEKQEKLEERVDEKHGKLEHRQTQMESTLNKHKGAIAVFVVIVPMITTALIRYVGG